MNTTDYLREGYQQLMDNKFYTKINHDPTTEVSEKITQKLIQMKVKGLIREKNLEFLKPQNCKHGQFYLLPKIHKKVSQVDPFVVQLTTLLRISANL